MLRELCMTKVVMVMNWGVYWPFGERLNPAKYRGLGI